MARSAIGLDIGTSVVRAAELSIHRGQITLDHFGQVALPEGAVLDGRVQEPSAVVEAIRTLWSATGFSHRRVILGVANAQVIVRQIDLPWMEQAELRSSLALQVADFLPLDVAEAVLDFVPQQEVRTAEGDRKVRGWLVAAARDLVLGNARCAQGAGLQVSGVDLSSFAVLRAMARPHGVDARCEALVDIGARATHVVVHQDGVPLFVRMLAMGGQDVTDALSDALGIPSARAEGIKQDHTAIPDQTRRQVLEETVGQVSGDFVNGVRGSLDYFAASSPGLSVDRVVVSGGGSKLGGLLAQLAEGLRLPVLPGDPLWPLQIGRTGLDEDQLDYIKPLAAVPVGLALGAIR